ncbi:MAG: BrnT family toxin [Clostridium sp.]|nr:BrnT family toxin [Clostridium sp.]
MDSNKYITFILGGMTFEYDEDKNKANIEKHGISFRSAARVFFDYDRIEFYDEENSVFEDRYDTIGDVSAGGISPAENTDTTIGNVGIDDVLFVVYTERVRRNENGMDIDVIRLISARYATSFERGLYYGKCQ